jgi:putative ABC transport system ATP-binding protein
MQPVVPERKKARIIYNENGPEHRHTMKLEKVNKIYNSSVIKAHVLKDIDLEVHPGELLTILGPSGSGKSTLLHMMGLLDTPTTGKIFLNEKDVSKLTEDEAADERGEDIGFVFQAFNLIPSLTAIENVMLPMQIYDWEDEKARERAREILERLGMGDKLMNRPNQLSGGQQQRVAIARALSMGPSFLLADEPTGNLDSKSGEEVIKVFQELNNEGKTIVIVTHDPDMTAHADRIIYIRDGRIEKEVEKK